MRTIKFRGKRIDNGEWVYGDLEIQRKTGVRLIHAYNDDDTYKKQFVVIPETVGQFTGLCDCKGQEIYEGDICALDYQNGRMYMQVRWHEKDAHFGFQFRGENHIGCADAFGRWIEQGRIDVIGIVHDDPGFLEGGAK